ncbi:hypothetical protein GE21DRAFT_3320 [Neurospora crassa]|uniref:Uncharacterized protein n=2 Tax=Neurospora crassa TaxID=5141 RepID=Q1K5H5_NEUCR|nr:hypothetical protein NCU01686 [Neurospora crassa OR74A]EAA27656.1 hypothetical protein NCU01686 [Neurospora crassa OR74A]KHE82686.1 hypothetical protein GE21DRAFT_3320 [Neurospora crassa]CAB91276.2 hypothetical protein [Neurospora crassa]|eukprot:XP_956892.1 hypothetical protein NCU01686 [Neurospora crassa OR74A]
MSEDARSLGTLAAAVAPGYMQTAAATPFEASIAGSWTGLTGREQGRQQQGQILLRLQNTQTLFCEYRRQCSSSGNCISASASWCTVYAVARPGGVLKISQAHGSRAAEGILYLFRNEFTVHTHRLASRSLQRLC